MSADKIQEAVRLRTEGLSLRAIASKLGVDQKQVQRWLKAAGSQPMPRRVRGQDGRSYPARRVSAPDATDEQVADRTWMYSKQLDELGAAYWDLRALTRAILAEHTALKKAYRQGLTLEEAQPLVEAARCQILQRSDLWDPDREDGNPPDLDLTGPIGALADWLTPDGLNILLSDLNNMARRKCPHPE